jgi:hypothetical protein
MVDEENDTNPPGPGGRPPGPAPRPPAPAPRRPGRPAVAVKRDIQVYVVLHAEEDAALRELAATEGLTVADYLRMLVRREARRLGHLPAGTGKYLVAAGGEGRVMTNDVRGVRAGAKGRPWIDSNVRDADTDRDE